MLMPPELFEVFKVLAQSRDDLTRYFPLGEESSVYRRVGENGFYDDVWLPAKAAAMTCVSVIQDQYDLMTDYAVKQIASEIQSLILMMLEVNSEYHWMIDKNAFMIQGPNDTSWAILRRLATLGFAAIGSEFQPPENSFDEFIKLGEFSRWKIVPTSDDQG